MYAALMGSILFVHLCGSASVTVTSAVVSGTVENSGVTAPSLYSMFSAYIDTASLTCTACNTSATVSSWETNGPFGMVLGACTVLIQNSSIAGTVNSALNF